MPMFVASAVWLVSVTGSALPPSASGVDHQVLVSRLSSDSLAERDGALKQLSAQPLSPSELCGMIQRSGSPEQRARLGLLGPEAMRRTPRAAMGVRFSQDDLRAVVLATLDGFDSRRVLRPGDVLLSVDGQSVSNQASARPIIVSHDPGQEVDVQVLRGGRTVTARMTLGDFSALDRDEPRGFGSRLSMSDMGRAWELRLARESSNETAPLAGAVTAEQWSRLSESRELRRTRASLPADVGRTTAFWIDAPIIRGEPAGPMVSPDEDLVAGGEPRGGTEAATNTGRRVERLLNRGGAIGPGGRDIVGEFNKARQRMERLFQVQRELADVNLPAARRTELERELRELQSGIFADVDVFNPLRGER